MLHTLMGSLQDAGHEAHIFVTDCPEAPHQYRYEGISVTSANAWTARQYLNQYNPDVLITHHQNAPRAVRHGRKTGTPTVFLVHNDFEANRAILALSPDLVVFNTDWIREAIGYTGESVVVHPPVFPEEHATVPGECVTLVNLSDNKGARVFYALAERMPDTKFLGVEGGHGPQIFRDLPNVEIIQHTDRMRDLVWSRTRTLLMPSIYESYGMAGVEALASGIPVLAHPTPGLRESLGDAGIFLDRDDIDAWENELRRLADPRAWRDASANALSRSQQLDPTVELDRWVSHIEGLV